MKELLRKVEKELENIGEKGITSTNLDTTYKLIDIYKDIKEACYYEDQVSKNEDSYDARDSRGRYRDWKDSHDYREYNSYRNYPLSERDERYFDRIREGFYNYNEGRDRYRDGQSKEKMIDGVDMAMGALVNFVEYMMDNVETSQEKEVIRKHIDKLKKM